MKLNIDKIFLRGGVMAEWDDEDWDDEDEFEEDSWEEEGSVDEGTDEW